MGEMIWHLVTKNGKPQWLGPSRNYFEARISARNLNGFRSYGMFAYKVKSFWTHGAAMDWINDNEPESYD